MLCFSFDALDLVIVMLHFCLSVDDNEMLGSYSPKKEPFVWQSPEEEVQSGVMFRGVYNITSKFIDDDKHEHIKFKWAIKIVKAH